MKLEEMSLEQLAVLSKDEKNGKEAFSLIYSRVLNPARTFAFKMVYDEELSKEIVNEAFYKAFKAIHGYKPEHNFKTWFYTIIRHEALNKARLSRKREFCDINDFDASQNLFSKRKYEADYNLNREELRKRIEHAFSFIPEKMLEPLKIKYIGQRLYEEIAEEMKVPLGTVKSRVNRGRKLFEKNFRYSIAPTANL